MDQEQRHWAQCRIVDRIQARGLCGLLRRPGLLLGRADLGPEETRRVGLWAAHDVHHAGSVRSVGAAIDDGARYQSKINITRHTLLALKNGRRGGAVGGGCANVVRAGLGGTAWTTVMVLVSRSRPTRDVSRTRRR